MRLRVGSAGWRRVSRSDMPVGTCSTLFRLDYAGHTRTRQTFQMSPKRQRAQGTHRSSNTNTALKSQCAVARVL